MIRDLVVPTLGFKDGIKFIPTLGLGLGAPAPPPASPPAVKASPTTGLRESDGQKGGYLVPQQYGPVRAQWRDATDPPARRGPVYRQMPSYNYSEEDGKRARRKRDVVAALAAILADEED